MRRFSCTVVLLLFVTAHVRASNQDASFALHRVSVSGPIDGCGVDSPNALGLPCSDYTVTAPLGESYVFVVVGGAGDEGVTVVRFGVNYDGRKDQMNGIDPDLITFTYCNEGGIVYPASYGYGDFPNPNGQVTIIFDNYANPTCYEHPALGSDGRHAMIGYFYVFAHSEDVLRLNVPGFGRPATMRAADVASGIDLLITDCAGNTIDFVEALAWGEWPLRLGRVHFGGDGSEGYTPCGLTPAKATTWGKLKTTFGP
jgi:hypothetical protein